MADSKSKQTAAIPSSLWTYSDVPAPGLNDVLSQVAHFLEKLRYGSTSAALIAEAKKKGVEIDTAEWDRGISQEHSAPLLELWEQWYQSNDGFPMLPASSAAQKQIKEHEESSSLGNSESDSSDDDDDESEDSDSDEDSESEDETEGRKAGVIDDEAESTDDDSSHEGNGEEEEKLAASNKRKREDTPDSSSVSESDDSEDDDAVSDESDAPRAKRIKIEEGADSSDSEDDDSSDSSGSDSEPGSDSDLQPAESGATPSDDDSSSASESDDEDSSASSESDGSVSDSDDSESSASPPRTKKGRDEVVKSERGGSTSSSATLDHERAPALAPTKTDKKSEKNAFEQPIEDLLVPASAAPEVAPEDPHAGIHPDRLARMPSSKTEKFTRIPATRDNIKAMKKENVPFSRIPKDTAVNPKFASNAYVPYDYAQKAHEDLIVTKGKWFTKEKNKKKRGSYRGGAIDLTPRGIKFED